MRKQAPSGVISPGPMLQRRGWRTQHLINLDRAGAQRYGKSDNLARNHPACAIIHTHYLQRSPQWDLSITPSCLQQARSNKPQPSFGPIVPCSILVGLGRQDFTECISTRCKNPYCAEGRLANYFPLLAGGVCGCVGDSSVLCNYWFVDLVRYDCSARSRTPLTQALQYEMARIHQACSSPSLLTATPSTTSAS